MAQTRFLLDKLASRPGDDDVRALDDGLGHALTEGQRLCYDDVEEDICRRLAPMDRLVFGDVGFRVEIDRRFGTSRPNFDSADFWTNRSLSSSSRNRRIHSH